MIEEEHRISPLNPYGKLKFTHYNKDGSIKEEREEIMHSFVANFFDIFQTFLKGNRVKSITHIGGGTTDVADNNNKTMDADPGADYRGLFVGTGATAYSIDDTSLDSIISHGTSAGQLEYGGCNTTIPSNNRKAQLSRTFTNNSGGQITVAEVGLGFQEGSDGTTNPIMIARDVLNSAFDIADGEGLQIDYEFGFTEGAYNIATMTWQFVTGGTTTITWQGYDGNNWTDNAPTIYIDGAVWKSSDPDILNGIVLGTGDSPTAYDDTNLDSRIDRGGGAGELNQNNQSITYTEDSANNKITITIEGGFVNNSGDSITVREIGWYASFSNQDFYGLVWRGVLNDPVEVIDGITKIARINLVFQG